MDHHDFKLRILTHDERDKKILTRGEKKGI